MGLNMRNAALVYFLILIPCWLRAQNKRDDGKALYDLRCGEKIELIETGMEKHVGLSLRSPRKRFSCAKDQTTSAFARKTSRA